ncbi:hypothetical protein MTR_4g092910 [Medicago truncatula]|uniref:Uncharacterized protein n=1 Tax=Medicago truncatula TaxID=3880 RepID=G7JU13_MEDTR|nr:hypothetical protein MTR_4g092910 [Medicago truncatula]
MGLGSRWMMITRRTCAYDKINFPFNQVLDIQGDKLGSVFSLLNLVRQFLNPHLDTLLTFQLLIQFMESML